MTEQTTYPRRVEFYMGDDAYLGSFYDLIDGVLSQTLANYNQRAMPAIIKQSARSLHLIGATLNEKLPKLHTSERHTSGVQTYTVTVGSTIVIELSAKPGPAGGVLTIRWRKDGEQLTAQFCVALSNLTGIVIALPGVIMEPIVEHVLGPAIPPAIQQDRPVSFIPTLDSQALEQPSEQATGDQTWPIKHSFNLNDRNTLNLAFNAAMKRSRLIIRSNFLGVLDGEGEKDLIRGDIRLARIASNYDGMGTVNVTWFAPEIREFAREFYRILHANTHGQHKIEIPDWIDEPIPPTTQGLKMLPGIRDTPEWWDAFWAAWQRWEWKEKYGMTYEKLATLADVNPRTIGRTKQAANEKGILRPGTH